MKVNGYKLMKADLHPTTKLLKSSGERFEYIEKMLAERGSEGLVGFPIQPEIMKILEECRSKASESIYIKDSNNPKNYNTCSVLESWKYYSVLWINHWIMNIWDGDEGGIDNYKNPDKELNVCVITASHLIKDGFILVEPEIYGMVVEYLRYSLAKSGNSHSDRIVTRALLMVEQHEASKNISKPPRSLTNSIKSDFLTDHIQLHIGPVKEILNDIKDEIKTLHIEPSARHPYHTLITHGMSHEKMNIPSDSEESTPSRIEVFIQLPAYWRLDEESLSLPEWSWPAQLIRNTANYPKYAQTYLGPGHTSARSEETNFIAEFNSIIYLYSTSTSSDFDHLIRKGEQIDFLAIMPLYSEELKYKLAKGTNELLELFAEQNIETIVNISRENAAEEWYKENYREDLVETSGEIDFGKLSSLNAPQEIEDNVEALPSKLETIRQTLNENSERILERALNEPAVSYLLDLSYVFLTGKKFYPNIYKIANDSDSFQCAIATLLVLDANQAVYSFGKEEAVQRLIDQIGSNIDELMIIAPDVMRLTLSAIPITWSLEHLFCMEDSQDMANRAKSAILKLSEPQSIGTKIKILQEIGRSALGDRSTDSQLDSVVLGLHEAKVRSDRSDIEDWMIGLVSKMSIDTYEIFIEHGIKAASESLANSLSHECYAEDLSIIPSLIKYSLDQLLDIDSNKAGEIYSLAIEEVNKELNAQRILEKKKLDKKTLFRRLVEIKWIIQLSVNRTFAKRKPDAYPGEAMYLLDPKGVLDSMRHDDATKLLEQLGGVDNFLSFIASINSRFSRYTIYMLKRQVVFGKSPDAINKQMSDICTLFNENWRDKGNFFNQIYLLIIDFLFLVVGPCREILALTSLNSVLISFLYAILYLLTFRPLLVAWSTDWSFFRLAESLPQPRIVKIVRFAALFILAYSVVEWIGLIDLFSLNVVIFIFCPAMIALFPESLVSSCISFKHGGLRSLLLDGWKSTKVKSGKFIYF